MGGRKILITVSDEQYKALEKMAAEQGLARVSTLVRSLVVKSTNLGNEKKQEKEVSLTLENYDEIADYVSAKKLGNVAVFAGYAMEQHMQRYPLSEAQKSKLGKNIN